MVPSLGQVAAQTSDAAHAIISARAELRRFRSEMGKFRRFSRGLLNGGTHGYINVLENFPGRDSQRAVGGLHKIVASLPAMFTSERIPELQGTGELPGADQKSRAIDLPFAFCFPHFIPPLGREDYWNLVAGKTQFSWLDFL